MYIKDLFKNKNHPNCIINIINSNFDLFKYLNTDYNHVSIPLDYKYNGNSFFFDFKCIHKKKDMYISLLNDITNRNVTNDIIYIYFYNFNNANIYFQLYIKHLMEKCNHTKIIIATNRINSINISIKNQCITIPYNYSNDILNSYESTISNILYDTFKNNNFVKFKNKIKLFVYNLFKNEIIIDSFIHKFISHIFSRPYITSSIKFKIVKIVSNIDHKISIAYNKLVLYELLFIKLYNLIKPCLDTFYNL